jgi:hypothetical protein
MQFVNARKVFEIGIQKLRVRCAVYTGISRKCDHIKGYGLWVLRWRSVKKY